MIDPVPVVVLQPCRASGQPLSPGPDPVAISARDAQQLGALGLVQPHVPGASGAVSAGPESDAP